MAKGVAHAGKGKSLSSGEARENERRGWTEASYRRKNLKPWNNYDWSRRGLNFEIKDGKIIPLCSQEVSLYNRYLNMIKSLDFKEYKAGATNKQHTYVELILSGSTERMQKIAFGDQKVNFERNPEQWQNWGVKRTTGEGSIEEWAMDCYNFVCNKYGKQNIIGFEIHLDETEPHIHVNIVPTAIKKQRGRADSGYHKIVMEDGKPKLENGKTIPATYTKGKHVGEVIKISDKKYNELSDEKKQEYRKNERGTVRTISYATYFGDKLEERSQKMSELHDDFYKEVGKKWGFERGDIWAKLSDEERRERMRRTKEQRWYELKAKLEKEKAEKERDDVKKEVKEQNATMEANAEKIKSQEITLVDNDNTIKRQGITIMSRDALIKMKDERLNEQNTELQKVKEDTAKANADREQAYQDRDAAVGDKDIAVNEAQAAIRQRDAAVDEMNKAIDATAENRKTLDEQKRQMSNNETELKKQRAEKAAGLSDLEAIRSVQTLSVEGVTTYVKALPDIEFTVSKDVRAKLLSSLRSHPRIVYPNPSLTAKELHRIVEDEIDKVYQGLGLMSSKKDMLNKIKEILTDEQTILFSVVGAEQKKGIMEAEKKLYKHHQKNIADAVINSTKYNELEREGINKTSYENVVKERDEAQEKAERLDETEKLLEFAWPGITKAKNVLIDPSLDNNYMTGEQESAVRDVLRKDPENRLTDITKLISYACSFRNIPVGTRAEAIELAAESIIKGVAEKGYDLMKEATAIVGDVAKELDVSVASAAQSAASTAVCLMFGYLDAATTVSQGCGGGGENNDLPKKKDDEDDRKFFGRCLHAAVGMMKPKMKQGMKRS